MAVRSERERALDLAKKWEREAHDAELMATQPGYSTLEARMLRQQANVKRGCAAELKLEFATVPRG